MFRYKLTIILRSPLYVGGTKISDTFLRTKDYIPGGVIKAGVARAILDYCKCQSLYGGEKRKFWVEFKEVPECNGCSVRDLCIHFSTIRFENANIWNTQIVPVTARKCKYEASHGLTDSLIGKLISLRTQTPFNPPNCFCDERTENASGWMKKEETGFGLYSVPTQILTRVAIDRYRNVAADNMLYSLVCISDKNHGRDVYFTGFITSPTPLDKNNFPREVLLGGHRSKGLGRTEISIDPDVNYDLKSTSEIIDEFNQALDATEAKKYFAINLQSPLRLNLFERFSRLGKTPAEITTDQSLQIVSEAVAETLELQGVIELLWAEFSTGFGQGFDTSSENGSRKEAKLEFLPGSVFVYQYNDAIDSKVKEQLHKAVGHGIGLDTLDGFGTVSVCDKLHIQKGGRE